MENTPLISVIVPCYNQAQYLDECLQSVLDQTYQNWECIIVNDGSPDNTEEVVQEWLVKDSRFSYLKKENGGVASARNLGIDNSQAEWLIMLDGDDTIAPSYLQKGVVKANEGMEIIYSDAKYFGALDKDWLLEKYDFRKLLINNLIFCPAIFKKSPVRFDEKMIHGLEDWEFWINYISTNHVTKICKLNSIELFYRIKEDSRNHIVNNDSSILIKTKNYVYNKHLDLYIKYYGDYFTVCRANERAQIEIKKILNSRRNIFMNKFLKLFGK
ncbi:Glycosyltransferase involved in cell wall bisynthesis [Epilithonimonas bovis DSM 19482]|uniref:Glycosyltransferase involved in cell wall bisynthesis n=1 Tax=Epilithonimonas bovis DSM 19482 TaxID=1121284 RepID=A0A1U7PZB9_9FLAO|nr:glycosyltransferase family A protein [Epilithonimonas bovis]SIT97382.1 Glycosyltransferase involved in cell wall bisynthesis [Epilithonimonas bovis DSM 19482]